MWDRGFTELWSSWQADPSLPVEPRVSPGHLDKGTLGTFEFFFAKYWSWLHRKRMLHREGVHVQHTARVAAVTSQLGTVVYPATLTMIMTKTPHAPSQPT